MMNACINVKGKLHRNKSGDVAIIILYKSLSFKITEETGPWSTEDKKILADQASAI